MTFKLFHQITLFPVSIMSLSHSDTTPFSKNTDTIALRKPLRSASPKLDPQFTKKQLQIVPLPPRIHPNCPFGSNSTPQFKKHFRMIAQVGLYNSQKFGLLFFLKWNDLLQLSQHWHGECTWELGGNFRKRPIKIPEKEELQDLAEKQELRGYLSWFTPRKTVEKRK